MPFRLSPGSPVTPDIARNVYWVTALMTRSRIERPFDDERSSRFWQGETRITEAAWAFTVTWLSRLRLCCISSDDSACGTNAGRTCTKACSPWPVVSSVGDD